jgi:hypothetical protein
MDLFFFGLLLGFITAPVLQVLLEHLKKLLKRRLEE